MNYCESCKHGGNCEHEWRYSKLLYGCEKYAKVMTNEEWLHSPNTEQLADWLARITNAGYLLALRMKYHCDDVDAVREWLKQPHTDN